MDSQLHSQRQRLRQHMRAMRHSIPFDQQRQAAIQLAEQATQFLPVSRARRIALFWSVDGEIDTRTLIARLWHLRKQVYLPRIHPFSPGQLLFQEYTPHTPMVIHHWGISEPAADLTTLCVFHQLDIIMVPLVAFDRQGQRLGMGGGFYDRSLRHWQRDNTLPVGLAYNCQQVSELPVANWDIPLPAIITPGQIWQWAEPGPDNG